jgi:hypothetical protein
MRVQIMFKDTKSMNGGCGYIGNCCSCAYYWVKVLLIAGLMGYGISKFIQCASQSVIIAAAATVFLVLLRFKSKMMKRRLELKLARHVPDIYMTSDGKTKSITIHITASDTGSCVLKHVWECKDTSSDTSCIADKELIKMKLPQSIKMGTELAIKLPMPSKSEMDNKDCCAKIGMKLYVSKLNRNVIVKICPYSICACYHIIPHCR